MLLRAASTGLGLVLGTSSACAWGGSGHAIIGEVAQRNLAPVAAAGVAELLGSGASLASIGSWADDERARDPSTARWHFVSIPLSAAEYDPLRDCVAETTGDCILAEIERERATVACETAPLAERQRALKFLVHFVGDLHQPLHTVLEARGGNQIAVTVVTREKVNGDDPFNTNLHAAWDGALIDKTVWSWGTYLERLETGPAEVNASLLQGTPVDWANESHAVAARIVANIPANFVLDDVYRVAALPDLDRQLTLGGLRLATVLNDAFEARLCP